MGFFFVLLEIIDLNCLKMIKFLLNIYLEFNNLRIMVDEFLKVGVFVLYFGIIFKIG